MSAPGVVLENTMQFLYINEYSIALSLQTLKSMRIVLFAAVASGLEQEKTKMEHLICNF